MQLKDKIVLVTGSSSGIGQAIAVLFAKKGAVVLVHFHKNEAGAKKTLKEIEKYSKGYAYKADLMNLKSVQALFKKIKKETGKVDVLVNNAGDAKPGGVFNEKIWRDQYENIFMSSVRTTNEFLGMSSKAQRKIINISSIYGSLNLGNPEFMQYSAMKAAVSNFTANLAKKLGNNVLVNAVAPGFTWTPAWEGTPRKEKLAYGNANKIKRFIKPEEIAQAVIMLAENDAITGQVITVDGGLGLQNLLSHE